LFIGGIQPKTVRLDKHARICPRCGHHELYSERWDQYCSLFFIPLFRVKKGIRVLYCNHCRSVFDESEIPLDVEVEERVMFRKAAGKCPDCGRSLQEDFEYCPRCGKKVRRQ
jgi:RNA polymerase subunit RPABC4/transcription elongation factor Spt4